MGKKQTKPPTHFVVNDKKYNIVKKVADGGFSTIYKVKRKGDVFALKRIGVYDGEEVEKCIEEAKLMQKFSNNPHIMKCFDYCSRPNENGIDEVIIVMEYCKKNLNEVMLGFDKNKKYDSNYKMMIFHQICLGLAEFHYSNPPLIHRDIKTENILQQSDDHFILCDFGSVTNRTYDPKITSFNIINDDINTHTTIAYRSPEMISQLDGKLISTKADIWALGCLLYKIYYGDTPFGESLGKIIDGFSGLFPSTSTVVCPDDVKDLIKYMLHSDPDKRPNIYEIHLKSSQILKLIPKLSPMTDIIPQIYDEKLTSTNNIVMNSDKNPSQIFGQNPFGQNIPNHMNFSQCRELAQNSSCKTDEASSKEEYQQQSRNSCYSISTESINKCKIDLPKFGPSQHPNNILPSINNPIQFENVQNIKLHSNTNFLAAAPARSHSRHRSLNEKMLNLSFANPKNMPRPHINNNSSTKNDKRSSLIFQNNIPSNSSGNDVSSGKLSKHSKSKDEEIFNPFDNDKFAKRNIVLSKSKIVQHQPSIDQTNITRPINPFCIPQLRQQPQPQLPTPLIKNYNPFRNQPPLEEHSQITSTTNNSSFSDQRSHFPDNRSPNSVTNNSEVSYGIMQRPKYPNPFITCATPQPPSETSDP